MASPSPAGNALEAIKTKLEELYGQTEDLGALQEGRKAFTDGVKELKALIAVLAPHVTRETRRAMELEFRKVSYAAGAYFDFLAAVDDSDQYFFRNRSINGLALAESLLDAITYFAEITLTDSGEHSLRSDVRDTITLPIPPESQAG